MLDPSDSSNLFLVPVIHTRLLATILNRSQLITLALYILPHKSITNSRVLPNWQSIWARAQTCEQTAHSPLRSDWENLGDTGQPYRPLVIPAKKNWPESPDLQSFVNTIPAKQSNTGHQVTQNETEHSQIFYCCCYSYCCLKSETRSVITMRWFLTANSEKSDVQYNTLM